MKRGSLGSHPRDPFLVVCRSGSAAHPSETPPAPLRTTWMEKLAPAEQKERPFSSRAGNPNGPTLTGVVGREKLAFLTNSAAGCSPRSRHLYRRELHGYSVGTLDRRHQRSAASL